MSGIRVRAYLDDDLERIVALRRAVGTVDRTDDGLAVAEPPPDPLFSGATQHEDTFVVDNDGGGILATGQLQAETGPRQSFLWAFPVVHPEWGDSAIEKLVLDRLWERARERRRVTPTEAAYLYVHCCADQEERIALYESCGLRFVRSRPHMIYHPLEKLARPEAPSRMTLRPCVRALDDASAIDTLNDAFADDWEFVPVTEEAWSLWLDAPQWRQDLNLVAVERERVIGLCVINEERCHWPGRKNGYIDTLCVRPSHQRRGVGEAFLLTGLQTLRRAGMDCATLETDEDNPTQAPRFYARVGFREIWRWVAYGTELR